MAQQRIKDILSFDIPVQEFSLNIHIIITENSISITGSKLQGALVWRRPRFSFEDYCSCVEAIAPLTTIVK